MSEVQIVPSTWRISSFQHIPRALECSLDNEDENGFSSWVDGANSELSLRARFPSTLWHNKRSLSRSARSLPRNPRAELVSKKLTPITEKPGAFSSCMDEDSECLHIPLTVVEKVLATTAGDDVCRKMSPLPCKEVPATLEIPQEMLFKTWYASGNTFQDLIYHLKYFKYFSRVDLLPKILEILLKT